MRGDGWLLAITVLVGLALAAVGVLFMVQMFKAAERGDTAETIAWGVVVLGFWLSGSRRERDR